MKVKLELDLDTTGDADDNNVLVLRMGHKPDTTGRIHLVSTAASDDAEGYGAEINAHWNT